MLKVRTVLLFVIACGGCKGNPQTSAAAANACAADLNGLSCSDFTSSPSGSDVCKTELCAS